MYVCCSSVMVSQRRIYRVLLPTVESKCVPIGTTFQLPLAYCIGFRDSHHDFTMQVIQVKFWVWKYIAPLCRSNVIQWKFIARALLQSHLKFCQISGDSWRSDGIPLPSDNSVAIQC